jgi:hypothetical protein
MPGWKSSGITALGASFLSLCLTGQPLVVWPGRQQWKHGSLSDRYGYSIESLEYTGVGTCPDVCAACSRAGSLASVEAYQH